MISALIKGKAISIFDILLTSPIYLKIAKKITPPKWRDVDY